MRDILYGAPSKVETASVLPPDVIPVAKELTVYVGKFGLVGGEEVQNAVFLALKDIVKKNQHSTSEQSIKGKYTKETVNDLKESIGRLVSNFGGETDIIDLKFKTLLEWAKVRIFFCNLYLLRKCG
jgi:hypothetical protein